MTRHHIPIFLFLLARSCAGIIVPESIADGVYGIPFDGNGNALAEPIPLGSSPVLSRIMPRQQTPPPLDNPQPHCGAGGLNGDEFASIQSTFDSMCDAATQYGPNMAIVMTLGNSIAYMCNFAGTNRCWRQEYDEANSILDSTCGVDHIGSVYVDRWKKSYGRDVKGADIC